MTDALNTAAGMIAGLLNPENIETGDTIRDASVLDLLVNATSHLLASPGATIGQVIAASYADIEPSPAAFGQHWNQHGNDIGDGCKASRAAGTPQATTTAPKTPAARRAAAPAGSKTTTNRSAARPPGTRLSSRP